MLALVLGGGGAKGSYEMGVWKALMDLDMEVDLVVGTSIGAVNGALFAQGNYSLAEKLWTEFDLGEMLGVEDYKEKGLKEKLLSSLQIYTKELLVDGGIDLADFRAALSQFIDEDKVRASKTRFGLVTVNVEDRQPYERMINEIPRGQLIDYIMASSAIVPALKPYEIDGKKYIDGAYYDNVPMELALREGARDFIVVDLNSFGRIRKKAMQNVDKDRIRYIRSYWDLGFGLVLDEGIVARNISLGYYDTLKLFSAFDGNAYTFIKDSKHAIDDKIRKNGELAELFGIHYSRSKTVFEDKLVQAKWKLITDERNKKGNKKTSDIMAVLEIAAEILELDPTKIYTVDSMNLKIKKALKNIEIPEIKHRDPKKPKEMLKSISSEVEALSDDKKRLKYFAREIKNAINKREKIVMQPLVANVYTRTFAGALYIALQDLI